MSSLNLRYATMFAAAALMMVAGVGCVEDTGGGTATVDSAGSDTEGGSATAGSASGVESKNNPAKIKIDGSSTVHPISEGIAAAWKKNVDVAAPSGTTAGFDKFILGETDINDASRPIKDSEIEKCKEAGIEWLELKVAIDGISVVVNKENTWCDSLTYEQLKALWETDSKINTWKDLDPAWPDEKIKLFGPDDKSGTFEYFTGKVVKTKNECRTDYEPSTDDNVLVTGVSGDKNALGYFGYGYYVKSRAKLKGLAIAKDGNPVTPTVKSIESFEYPISRPIFIYVNKARLGDEGMTDFLKYYLSEAGQKVVPRVGCVKLPKEMLTESVSALEEALK